MLLDARVFGQAPFRTPVFSAALVLRLGSGSLKWVSCLAFFEAGMLETKEMRQKLALLF